VTSRGHILRHRRGLRGVGVTGLAVAVAFGFALGAIVEVLLMGEGWRAVFEDVLYPLSFVVAMAGVFLGGFMLLAAEHDGNQPRAWRAVGVFVASTVFAALLFWGAI
jgi:hypothetical protein